MKFSFLKNITALGMLLVLIAACENEAELYGVIGHELAHQLKLAYPEIWQELAKVALSLTTLDRRLARARPDATPGFRGHPPAGQAGPQGPALRTAVGRR